VKLVVLLRTINHIVNLN